MSVEIIFEKPSGEMASLVVDAAVREGHQASSRPTERRVEVGVPVSDHVRINPDRFRVEAHFTNTPVRAPQSLTEGATYEVGGVQLLVPVWEDPRTIKGFGALGPLSPSFSVGVSAAAGAGAGANLAASFAPPTAQLGGGVRQEIIKANVMQASQDVDRVVAAYVLLHRLVTQAAVVSILTSLRAYHDMVLANLSAPRAAEDGEAITFSIDAQRIRFARSETVEAPEPAEPRGRRQRNRGNQDAPAVPDGADSLAEDNRSLAAQGLDAIF